MTLYKRKKGEALAATPIRYKPFKSDMAEIDRLCGAWGKDRPEVTRELIAEALKARRLKAVGKDEATEAVIEAQKRAMTEVLTPISKQIATLTQTIERSEARMIDEFEHAAGRLRFLVLAVRFIVVEVMVNRVLLRDYVHTAYRVLVEKAGKSTAEIEKNFGKRLEVYRAEAEGQLDRLTEAGVGGIQEMIERDDVFIDTPPKQ